MTPLEAFAAQPAGVKAWVAWLFLVNAASVLFVRRSEARWVLAAMVLNILGMAALLRLYGGGPHTSLPHVVLWTPLLVYLGLRAKRIAAGPRVYAAWAVLLFCSDGISLVLDTLNVARWALT